MDMSFETVNALWRPSFVFKYRHIRSQTCKTATATPWENSALNPKNRVDGLPVTGACRWRVDGSATFKTRFYAVPLDLLETGRLPPLRIDVFLPDQGEYPPALRHSLDAAAGVPLQHAPAVAALGISRYICRVLELHSARNPSFLDKYRRLPFGSRIIISHVVSDISHIDLVIQPNYTLEGATTSLSTLRESWVGRVPEGIWPPAVDIYDLCVIRQLHDSVALVKVQECKSSPDLQGQLAVFKSGSDDFHHVLHELKMLLTIPPHANLIGQPMAIVTKRSCFGGKQGVYGFLIPYLPSGSLRDLLPAHSPSKALDFSTRLRWGTDVASALLHVFEQGGAFYSDLRPDNVLLNTSGSAVLCDFEQRGNWHEWCPPEVLYPQYMENLLNVRHRFENATYDPLIADYTRKRPVTPNQGFVESKNRPWFALSRQSQEKAMVYTLGLFLYCIFEGLSSVSPSLPYRFPFEPSISFPTFRHTPRRIRNLIWKCTADAPHWRKLEGSMFPRRKVVRVGSLLYPMFTSAAKVQSQCDQPSVAVLDAALDWWLSEIEHAKQFLASDEWHNQEFGVKRPCLRGVVDTLQQFQNESQHTAADKH